VVDLPTPPFWLAIATMRATPGSGGGFGCVAFFDLVRGRVALVAERADAEDAAEEGLLTAGP